MPAVAPLVFCNKSPKCDWVVLGKNSVPGARAGKEFHKKVNCDKDAKHERY